MDSLAVGPQIAVVARSGCKYCLKAKDLLTRNDIEYAEVDVTDNVGLLSIITASTGHRTVPQVFVNGRFVGGATELEQLFDDGSLKSMLEAESKAGLPEDLERKIQQYREEEELKHLGEEDVMEDDTPPEVLALAQRLQGVRQDAKTTQNWTYSSACTGKDLLEWLTNVKAGEKGAAVEAGRQLLKYGLVYPIKDRAKTFIFFKKCSKTATQGEWIEDSASEWYALKGTKVQPKARGAPLNSHYMWNKTARPAILVSSHLRSLISRLYDDFLSKDGKGVSYIGMASSPLFQEYVDATAELQQVNLHDLTREELMCFFINLYNALIIHATVVFGPPDSTLTRAAFFTKWSVYNVAGYDYTADDMEHGVLRGNKAPPSSLGSILGLPALASPQFKPSDPRSKKVVTPMDPRIHFALVCGAKSCPPIRIYEPDSLEEGLQGAAESFCAGEVAVDKHARKVTASMILKWYGIDFGSTKLERLQALLPYMQGSAKEDLRALIAESVASKTDIQLDFAPYDWNVNSLEVKDL